MSVRGVWVIKLQADSRSAGKLLFARVYPTVERRASVYNPTQHVPLPDNTQLLEDLLTELGVRHPGGKFVEARDSCIKVDQKPVFDVQTASGKLWPVLVIEQYGLLYCCVPLVENWGSDGERPKLVQIPGLPIGFSLLLGMADFVGKIPPNEVSETNPRFSELYMFLSQAAPFGRPVDANSSSVDAVLHATPLTNVPNQKQPAWRPSIPKAKPNLYFAISEQIRCVQYASDSIQDVWQVYGSITCKAELEGLIPEVTVTISLPTDQSPITSLILNPCVQTVDTGGQIAPVKPPILRFTPPTEMFLLSHYTAKVPELPIKGVYQMKGDHKVDVFIQLYLNEKIKNNFSYCLVNIPFYHRGPVMNFESSPSHGSVNISNTDSRVLVWNIGQKFPSKSLEVTLKATVQFSENPQPSGRYEDPFCVGQNAYAQLFFKCPDFTHTGSYVDLKSVLVKPNTKCKITTVREYLTSDYKIWNSHGDSQMAFSPAKQHFTESV